MNAFETEWLDWHAARNRTARAPLGPASLAATHWLTATRQELPDLEGTWHARDGHIHGGGLVPGRLARPDGTPAVSADGTVRLHSPEDELHDGERRLRLFAREGALALRVFDPAVAAVAAIELIDTYPPDPAWAVPAVLAPGDGAGTVTFTLDGTAHRLRVTRSGERLSAVFGDATNGAETYRFRFLGIDAPGPDGTTMVDFNRAFLPPCAFSPHFVCPLPPPGNRLPVAVTAGEKALARYAPRPRPEPELAPTH